jgi:hypothetical protein
VTAFARFSNPEVEMDNQKGQQKGPQNHAEGQHGEKTHEEFIEELHGRHGGSEESEGAPQGGNDVDEFGRPIVGRHRLQEDREQHDEAEKNSEANRLRR